MSACPMINRKGGTQMTDPKENKGIQEVKILEFKTLTVTKATLGQIRQIIPTETTEFIGYVKDGVLEYYIVQMPTTLLKVSRADLWNWMVTRLGGQPKVARDVGNLGCGISTYIQQMISEYRDSVPQIFVR